MRIIRAAYAALVMLAAGGPAAAFEPVTGAFVPSRACPATDSIRRQSNPGNVMVEPGRAYQTRALNKAGGDYVQVEVPGATPPSRWVAIACGSLGPDAPGGSASRPESQPPPSRYQAFFDDRDEGPGDPAPRAPALEPFDRAVLGLCGGWGSRPSRQAFRAMLDEAGLRDDVAAIETALGRDVRRRGADPARFKDDLTAIWFAEAGFAHVFCGEPSERTIGGLHYAGRYLQMQQEGWGGLAHCARQEVDPPIYTIGVVYRTPSGQEDVACPKGYALPLNARDLLIEATRAFQELRTRAPGESMCLHTIRRPSGRRFTAVLVARAGAIRTFYPDATPTCGRGQNRASCACSG